MREKIVSRGRPTPKIVNLPNGISFVSIYERISRKQLPRNIRVTRARKVGPRKHKKQIFVNLAAPDFKKIRSKRRLAGRGVGEKIVKLGIEMGSKALNSLFGKRLIEKSIDNIPNIFKFGASKIKNKNLKRALDSKVANMVVEEAQKKVANKYDSLFRKNGRNKQLSDRRCDKKHWGRRSN